MKSKFLSLFLVLSALVAYGQESATLDGWASRLRLFGEKLPQEEVFLHTDNTCYYLGDTLYYKAYMRLSDGRPSPLSRLLYVELLNQDGYLVELQKVEMKNGQGWGSFVLPDTLYGGFYELRAYTRWQLNWGQTEHPHTRNADHWFLSNKMRDEYYRDYEKLYSRVFPVYDHPREPGDYAQDMTLRPLQRVVKQQEAPSRAVVRFYPEGGHLVAGVPNRVAFEANDEEGKHLKGSLFLTLSQGRGTVKAETVSRGRGVFETDGTVEEAYFEWEGGRQELELPRAVADGVAMRAAVEADGIHVHLQPQGAAAREPLGLTASCHGIQKDFQPVGDGVRELTIPLDKLPTGVIQLTLFNAEGRVYADRLVFVRRPDFQSQNITFTGVKPQYEPYEEVAVDVKCLLSDVETHDLTTSISLAVRDAAHSDYTFDSGNILTEMLLSSQIRGFVEQPEYFFESDDEEHRRALDLLLMVQGWRRYDWVTMATPGAFSLREPYERTEILMGEVSKYQTEQQADARMEAMDKQNAEIKARLGSAYAGPDIEEDSYEEMRKEKSPKTESEMEKEMSQVQERMAENDKTRGGTTVGTNAEATDQRIKSRNRGANSGSLRNEVLVHAEFIQPGAKKEESMVEGDMTTYNNGIFKIEGPLFYGACLLSYGAVDEDKWKGEHHIWMEPNEDQKGRVNYPDYYVKLTPPRPRFVKPYTFYQQTLPTARAKGGRPLYVDDDAILMNEVTIGVRRGGLRSFDASKPAFVVDAYEAFNAVCDAGFCPGYYVGYQRFMYDIARTYIGDMNMERAYKIEPRFDSKNQSSSLSPGQLEKYNHQPNLDMVYIYTDYSPRLEGNRRYSQSNQPTVTVDLRLMPDDGQRVTYRNRHTVLTGFAVCEDFYQPDYSKQRPEQPTDYRRTLYWNPNLQLDGEGRASVRFFTGSRPVQLNLSAEGMTPTGQPLTGIRYAE